MIHVLIQPYDFQKNIGANHKIGQLAPKPSIFKTAEIHHGAHFHMWVQNSNAYNLYMAGKEILSRLILSLTLGSKIVHIRAIDRKPKGYILTYIRVIFLL